MSEWSEKENGSFYGNTQQRQELPEASAWASARVGSD